MGMIGEWQRTQQLAPRQYHCSHPECGLDVESEEGWVFLLQEQYEIWFIYVCPSCKRPTYFDHQDGQLP